MNYEAEIILTATCAHIYKHPTTTSNAFFLKKRKKDQIHSHKMIPDFSSKTWCNWSSSPHTCKVCTRPPHVHATATWNHMNRRGCAASGNILSTGKGGKALTNFQIMQGLTSVSKRTRQFYTVITLILFYGHYCTWPWLFLSAFRPFIFLLPYAREPSISTNLFCWFTFTTSVSDMSIGPCMYYICHSLDSWLQANGPYLFFFFSLRGNGPYLLTNNFCTYNTFSFL